MNRDGADFSQAEPSVVRRLERAIAGVLVFGGLGRLRIFGIGWKSENSEDGGAESPDQRAFVRQAIESGRFDREERAVQEALSLWEERERRRAEILTGLDEADASLARGEGRTITEASMTALAAANDEVKQRGRRRLAAERPASR